MGIFSWVPDVIIDSIDDASEAIRSFSQNAIEPKTIFDGLNFFGISMAYCSESISEDKPGP